MKSLDEIINESKDVREVKRAVSVKMVHQGVAPAVISTILNISPQYISKWKGIYETEGADALAVAYRGSESYLGPIAREGIVEWIAGQESLTLEQVRDYIESTYGVVYQSKQSYYDLLSEGGMSYHKSEKVNPKRDEGQVLERREVIKKNWRRIGKR